MRDILVYISPSPPGAVLLALADVPLRTASFSLENRRLLWSRAHLYTDRLTLHGWGLRGRYWRDVPLEKIEQVEYNGQTVTLRLEDATDVSLRFSKPERWVTAVRAHRVVKKQHN